MKAKLFLLPLLAALGCGQAEATQLYQDSFTYPDGALLEAAGAPWVLNYPGSNNVPVTAGRIFLTQAEGQSVRYDIVPALGTGSVFVRLRVNFTELPDGGGNYFAFFRQENVDNLRGRLWASTNGAAAGKFRLGCSSFASAPALISEDLSLHTDYTLVMRYNITNYITTVWINPSSESDTNRRADYLYERNPATKSVGHFGFKQVGDYEGKANGMGSLYVDDLRLGTTFYDVLPEPTLTNLVRKAANQIVLNGVGIPTTNYVVLATTNLGTTNWVTLGNTTADTNGVVQFTDTAAANLSGRFYRLQAQ